MSRIIRRTTQFKRDYKRIKKHGKRLERLREVVQQLAAGQPLEDRYRDHPLLGGYRGARECHIEPDWLLIYEVTEEELVLIRTGSHADLFA